MKLLSLVLAAAIVACAADALIFPALAQQNAAPAESSADGMKLKQTAVTDDIGEARDQLTTPSATGSEEGPPPVRVIWGTQPPSSSVIDNIQSKYTIFGTDPVRATADADAHAKSKGGATVQSPAPMSQKQWTPQDFRLTPSDADADADDDDDDSDQ